MTTCKIEAFTFSTKSARHLKRAGDVYTNWPVVYTLSGDRSVYVGETRSMSGRIIQHLQNPEKADAATVHVIIDDTFNKSACLDLESFLIQMFAGDGKYLVKNRNDGVLDSNYYQRADYRSNFHAVFEALKNRGLFTQSIGEIQNSDLFKLSPFKSLNTHQERAIRDILANLLQDVRNNAGSMVAIEGAAGTGKTIIAIYLIKLLTDIASYERTMLDDITAESDGEYSDYFNETTASLLRSARIGLVIPQQSLRESIRRVFRKTPGLSPQMVVTPFEVGLDDRPYDLLVVDETHRLNQRANQSSGVRNKQYAEISEKLFGDADDVTHTQIDWIRAQSTHQVFLLDVDQGVRPADIPRPKLRELANAAEAANRRYILGTQMRVSGGEEYVRGARALFSGTDLFYPPQRSEYDFRIYRNFRAMVADIDRHERASGLARLVAGYGFEWKSQRNTAEYDIEIDGIKLRWNTTPKDWINSPTSAKEVGSIHTVQGYDLNYAGVIIGPELRYDERRDRLYVDRDYYFDKKGKENNPKLGISYSDADLLEFIRNIYAVLMTRGMRGTYVYAATPDMLRYLQRVSPWATVHSDRGSP